MQNEQYLPRWKIENDSRQEKDERLGYRTCEYGWTWHQPVHSGRHMEQYDSQHP